jgi:hypothetical protein
VNQEIPLLVQDDPIFPSVRVNDPHPSRSISGLDKQTQSQLTSGG